MQGEEVRQFATTVAPLPEHEHFICCWDAEKGQWVYRDKPYMGNVNPLDRMLTYSDCRVKEYPRVTEYMDGIVKGDTEQMNKYIEDCLAVKERWPKSMEPITLREYYQRNM